MNFLKLIRIQNLLLLALMQVVFRYGFLKLETESLALTNWQYVLLILSTVLIAAGGYVINDIFDQDTDQINNKKNQIVGKSISENTAYNIYVALTIIGVGIGFYLSNAIMRPGFATLFILIATLLYFYATTLKQILLIGNIIVALLLSFSVLIIVVYDLFPATDSENRAEMMGINSILFDYAIFAFIINFIREIVKDCQDYKGDFANGMKTLPIVIGISKTSKIVAGFSIIPVFFLLRYIVQNLLENDLYYAAFYGMFLVVAPLILAVIKMFAATEKSDFKAISTLLKVVIFFGIMSIMIVKLNIMHNV